MYFVSIARNYWDCNYWNCTFPLNPSCLVGWFVIISQIGRHLNSYAYFEALVRQVIKHKRNIACMYILYIHVSCSSFMIAGTSLTKFYHEPNHNNNSTRRDFLRKQLTSLHVSLLAGVSCEELIVIKPYMACTISTYV